MDPETPQERIDEILNAIEGKKGFFERISGFLFNWIDSGLYTKKLPKQAILEEKLEAYFDKEAPNIHELASYRIANNFDSAREQFKVVLIISPEQNRKQGFDKVPCPNLFKYPNESLHFSKLLGTWGNIQDESNTSLAELEKQQGKKKRKKRK